MKFEDLMLKSLFVASLLLCLGVLGSMLALPTPQLALASSHAPVAASAKLPG